MRGPLLQRAYRRLGKHYPAAFLALELQAGFLVTATTVGLLSFYYEGSAAEFLAIGGIAIGLTAAAIAVALWRGRGQLGAVKAWLEGSRDERATLEAWRAALALPLTLVRSQIGYPVLGVAVPSCIAAILILELSPLALLPLMGASVLAIGYGAILHYLTIEIGLRPVLIDITRSAPAGMAPSLERVPTVPLRVRLLATLPVLNVITGFVVAALTAEGSESLGASVLVAIGVSTAIALELIVLLTRSILEPVDQLIAATERVGEGELDANVPVTTADELGALSTAFNRMLSDLRDRERVREAFGTYLDEEVADYILSDGFSEEGVELELTIMFCDAVGFTRFAAGADAREVVAELNALFEAVVPVLASHGGHVDKFEGDGLMAAFGAPRPDPEHALAAVRAAIEIERRVNAAGEGGSFELGIGINTGRVVAGSIGGGGRLNFSVIGDPVNVAARVEGLTRRTGDGILLTEATASQLEGRIELVERGSHELRGIAEPVRLWTPRDGGSPSPPRERPAAIAR